MELNEYFSITNLHKNGSVDNCWSFEQTSSYRREFYVDSSSGMLFETVSGLPVAVRCDLPAILSSAHVTKYGEHLNINQTLCNVNTHFVPNIELEVHQFIEGCLVCSLRQQLETQGELLSQREFLIGQLHNEIFSLRNQIPQFAHSNQSKSTEHTLAKDTLFEEDSLMEYKALSQVSNQSESESVEIRTLNRISIAQPTSGSIPQKPVGNDHGNGLSHKIIRQENKSKSFIEEIEQNPTNISMIRELYDKIDEKDNIIRELKHKISSMEKCIGDDPTSAKTGYVMQLENDLLILKTTIADLYRTMMSDV